MPSPTWQTVKARGPQGELTVLTVRRPGEGPPIVTDLAGRTVTPVREGVWRYADGKELRAETPPK